MEKYICNSQEFMPFSLPNSYFNFIRLVTKICKCVLMYV